MFFSFQSFLTNHDSARGFLQFTLNSALSTHHSNENACDSSYQNWTICVYHKFITGAHSWSLSCFCAPASSSLGSSTVHFSLPWRLTSHVCPTRRTWNLSQNLAQLRNPMKWNMFWTSYGLRVFRSILKSSLPQDQNKHNFYVWIQIVFNFYKAQTII